jgi:crotonobetainyl-CoA:carnitine CoA-transferase CaiB-like acyl-CoA transferase
MIVAAITLFQGGWDTFMGPYASLLLAQMGAEVIKVELPAGDITWHICDVTGTGSGPVFLNVNLLGVRC